MRLKSLQIKGFKSFAHDTVLNFEHDVIGIVGPNGAGKSNIVDAMRWVLGEQKNKELRLEQMRDVIFNGTAKKKKSYKAEVSVTFDNTKGAIPLSYNTIKITRTLYQSGESEYALNDTKCRLKDIQNLFMDSGIGSNSYAIIELGMVDDILQNKENARRRMFEQAAGISKYKQRKKESLQKLKLTGDDLDRLEDLVFEIKSNLKQLEKQARRAAKFQKLKEERKALFLWVKKSDYSILDTQQKSCDNQLESSLSTYQGTNVNLRKVEAKIEAFKKTHLNQEIQLNTSQKELSALVDEIAKFESDQKLTNQKIEFNESQILKISEEGNIAKPKLELLEIEIGSLDLTLKDLEQKLQQEIKSLDDKESTLEIALSSAKKEKEIVEDIRYSKNEFISKRFNLEKQIALIDNKIDQISIRSNTDASKLERVDFQMSDSKRLLEEIKSTEKKINKDIKQLKLSEKKRKETIDTLYINEVEISERLRKMNRQLDAAKHESDLLESMIQSMEGYPESNKYVLQHISSDFPLLADVIHCDERYRIAIETYLAPYLNYFIANDAQQAEHAIHEITKVQMGRVHFFLNSQQEESSHSSLLQKGINALDVVSCDAKYLPVIKSLLSHVWLIKESEISGIAKEYLDEKSVILSESGSLLYGKQYVSGGSIGLFEGKRTGRKQQLSVLKEKIDIYNTDLHELKGESAELQKAKLVVINASETQKIQEFEKKVLVLEEQLKAAEQSINRYSSERDTLHKAEIELRKNLKSFQSEKIELHEKLETCLQSIVDLETKGVAAGEIKNKHDQEISEATNLVNQQKLITIRLENSIQQNELQRNHVNNSITEISRALQSGLKSLKILAQELEDSKNASVKLESKLLKLLDNKDVKAVHLNEFERNYFESRGELHDLEDQQRHLQKALNQNQILVNQFKDKLVEIRFSKEKITERVRIEFDENLVELEILLEDDLTDLEKRKVDLERLEGKLEHFTDVNPLALEAFNELEIRYSEIIKQKNDILDAKNDLLKTIDEIEGTATKMFLEAFEEVRKYFIKVFRSLFTQDDDCDLVLVNPDDPLNSDIEIMAKPKGKRPKSLSQLSGGEKTLTATALLFSLYLLKPAPFCIFDEVDAPLDDNNVQKFGNIIRAFSKESQFLIVTHNKLTMAEVDVLYGIFMQEKGISQVAPVDLALFNHEDRVGTLNIQ